MKILEQFWYGNIEPSEYDIASCREYKEVLKRHMDSVQKFMVVTECLLFQNSFKLGAKMMLEVMEE